MNSKNSSSILTNVAEAVITPPIGVEMIEPRGVPTTGIHDDLYVRAIAFHDGITSICIVTMDLLGLDVGLMERVQIAVQERTGLTPKRLMLAPSHNHSAPLTMPYDVNVQPNRDRQWEAHLVNVIAETVVQAQADLMPVSLSVGQSNVQIGLNRRLSTLSGTTMSPNPAGPVAPWVDVLRVDRANGEPLALLFSHAAHPVTVHNTATEFTADYPGVAVRTIRQQLGDGVMPLFAQGCAADINVNPLRGGFAEAEKVGRVLGEAAMEASKQLQELTSSTIQAATKEITLDFELMDVDVCQRIIQRFEEAYTTLQSQGADQQALNNQNTCLDWGEKMLALARAQEPPPGLPFQIQAFTLGKELAIIGMPHELFVEYQLFLQQESPFPHTFVFGYVNCCESYVPTADAYYLQGYEPYGAQRLFGLPRLLPNCEKKIKESGLGLLEELWRM
ncbi:MAG: neutral/alkaline non-lysosomal ceramidase N-terminal domain-containing protein [Chloroflexota bacterium]